MTGIATLTMNPAIDLSTSTERVERTHKLRCRGLKRDPGGGGINVARVVRRLGGEVTAIFTAGGAIGDLLQQLVEAEGITSRPVRIAAQTRENFTVDEESSGEQFLFVLAGPEVAEPEWSEALRVVESLDPFPAYLVASGSLAPGVPDDFYARIARMAKARGGRFIVDTSGPALQAVLEEGAYLIKPNRREFGELLGESLDSEAACVVACRRIVDAGQASVVVLTLGEHGALLVTADIAWFASGLKVKAVSVVGAGDSFLGGMIRCLAAGRDFAEAFRCGVACGTAALLTPGTELCDRDDVERLLGKVELRVL